MKKLMILASMALLSACSNQEEMPESPEANEEFKTITVPISMGGTQTRIAVDGDVSTDDTSWNFVWEEDESVGVWHDDSCTELVEFTMAEDGFDEDESTFTGSVSASATQIRVISPYDTNNTSVSNVTYSIDISEQDGDLGKLYMISDELIDVSDESVTAQPDMKHMGGFFALNFSLANAEDNVDYEITEVKLSGVPTTMDVDLTGNYDNYSNMNSDATITATLSGITLTTANNAAMVRLNTLPFDFEKDAALTFEITYKYGSVEHTSRLQLINTSESAIPFKRAEFNYCSITLDPTKMNISGATINGWSTGNGDSAEDLGDLQPNS